MYGGLIGTHQRSFEWYHSRPLMASLSSKLGVCNLATPLISGTGKATDLKFGGYIYMANRNKSPLKILEKVERGRIRRVPKFFGYSLLSQERVKLRTSNIVGTFIESIRTKTHEKCLVAVGVVRDSRKFSGHPCRPTGRIARSSLRQHSFLVSEGAHMTFVN